jgi:IS5 family transposase
MPEGQRKAMDEWFERRKAQMRAFLEHPLLVIKHLFAHRKVSCRGIARNEAGPCAQTSSASQEPLEQPA